MYKKEIEIYITNLNNLIANFDLETFCYRTNELDINVDLREALIKIFDTAFDNTLIDALNNEITDTTQETIQKFKVSVVKEFTTNKEIKTISDAFVKKVEKELKEKQINLVFKNVNEILKDILSMNLDMMM